MAAPAKAANDKGKQGRRYGPATVIKPVVIGGFVLLLLNGVLGFVLGG